MGPENQDYERARPRAGGGSDAAVEQLLTEFSGVLGGMDRETLELFRARWSRLSAGSAAAGTILEVIDGQIALRDLFD